MAQCYWRGFGFYQLWIITMGSPVVLLALCVAVNQAAAWLQRGLGHPRDGGWLLPRLSDSRRAWWLDWATNLRSRCGSRCVATAANRMEQAEH